MLSCSRAYTCEGKMLSAKGWDLANTGWGGSASQTWPISSDWMKHLAAAAVSGQANTAVNITKRGRLQRKNRLIGRSKLLSKSIVGFIINEKGGQAIRPYHAYPTP